MEKGKAPGSDGFTVDFFQSCWDLIKEEIWEVVEESRNTRQVLTSFNATFLSLIPKEHGANFPRKFKASISMQCRPKDYHKGDGE